jgi:hypothetical protein
VKKIHSADLQCTRRHLKNESKPVRNSPLKKLLHPPYSLDISPSHFYLFGKVESALIGRPIPDEIGLLDAVAEILHGISNVELQRVFRSWINPVERVTEAGGNCLIWEIFSSSLSHSRPTPLWPV